MNPGVETLNTANHQVIQYLFGADFATRSQSDELTTGEVLGANEELSSYLYGNDVAELVKRHKIHALERLHTEILRDVSMPEEALRNIDLDKIGMVIIRPETLDETDDYLTLLETSGLSVIINRLARINFSQYWSLYNQGLSDWNSKHDFPTRTLNYVNKDIRILVVLGDPCVLKSASVSDFLTENIKGKQGTYTRNTLRGDIAYTALRPLVKTDGLGFIVGSNLALDPIGAYRKLVRGAIPSDRTHQTADSPLLFYAGQGVHIPSQFEIGRDMRVLCNEEDLAHIIGRANDEK